MESKTLTNLPDSILLHITFYLTHVDLLNFRISCSAFYHVCSCSDVLKRFHIRPKFVASKFLEFIKTLNRGRHIKLSLQHLPSRMLPKLFPTLSYATDLCIKIQDLKFVAKSCEHVRKLTLLDDQLGRFSSHNEDSYRIFFQCLIELKSLNEILLKGHNQAYSATALAVIINCTSHVTSFGIDSITVNNGKRPSLLADAFNSSHHITHWLFSNVVFINKNKIMLPSDVLSFVCNNTIISPLNETHTKLKKLCIYGIIPYYAKFWSKNNFNDLEYLELRNAYFYRSKLPLCSNLRVLKLLECYDSLNYLLNLSPAVENSLQLLTIRAYNKFSNENIIAVLNKFRNIEHLKLMNMNQITSLFLYEVKHEELKCITIQNCPKFNGMQTRSQLKNTERDFRFQVKIL